MKLGKIDRVVCVVAMSALLATASTASAANLLVNGDFEAAPILGAGQTGVEIGSRKLISTDPASGWYDRSISGIEGWTYAKPFENGTLSDHGLARRNADFGLSPNGQSAFINNWDRMMSQSVSTNFQAGDVLTASIDFGTLGSDTDGGRAGRFYLVAGGVNPSNPDVFAAGSIILAQLSVANATWTGFTPDVIAGNGQYVQLNLAYTVQASDAALGMPLTIAFRTEWSAVGETYWDNASLSVQSAPTAIPEPAGAILLGIAAVSLAAFRRRGA